MKKAESNVFPSLKIINNLIHIPKNIVEVEKVFDDVVEKYYKYDLKVMTTKEYYNYVNVEKNLLNEVCMEQDLMILEQDIRIMNIESTLPSTFSLRNAYNSRYFNLLNRIIETKNYENVEKMKNDIQIYFENGRINEEEYNTLINKLEGTN